jgi:hypothetical protein
MLTKEQNNKIRDLLESTNQSYADIGKQFGVSRQFIGQVFKHTNIKRQMLKVGSHRIDRCFVCQEIIDKANRGVVCTTKQLVNSIGKSYSSIMPHMVLLRKHQIIPKEFCFFRSEKVVEAIKLYKDGLLSARQVGIKMGVSNFNGVLWRTRKKFDNGRKNDSVLLCA